MKNTRNSIKLPVLLLAIVLGAIAGCEGILILYEIFVWLSFKNDEGVKLIQHIKITTSSIFGADPVVCLDIMALSVMLFRSMLLRFLFIHRGTIASLHYRMCVFLLCKVADWLSYTPSCSRRFCEQVTGWSNIEDAL